MFLFAIELDEERIIKDDKIDLQAAYKCIDDTFAQKDVSLYQLNNKLRYYTRQIDYHDYEYLWMVNLAFEEVDWFRKYVKIWKYININEKTNEILNEEDLIEEWEIKG